MLMWKSVMLICDMSQAPTAEGKVPRERNADDCKHINDSSGTYKTQNGSQNGYTRHQPNFRGWDQ